MGERTMLFSKKCVHLQAGKIISSMEIHIKDLDNLSAAAETFVREMGKCHVFAFYGKMGAGKTTFIKAVCEVLGVRDVVNSPTFSIVNEYLDGEGNSIYHFDFYRLSREREALDIGIEDYLYSGNLCLMEWPEIVEALLPEGTMRITIEELTDGSRLVKGSPIVC